MGKIRRRVGQSLAVILIILGTLSIICGVASAHHADIAATVTCQAKVSYTVTDWVTTGAGLANPDIAVAYDTGSGWHALPSGAFSIGHTAFSGSFTPVPHITGTVVELRATVAAKWADGVAAGDSRTAQVLIPAGCGPTTTTTKYSTTTTTAVTTTTTVVIPTTTTVPNSTTTTRPVTSTTSTTHPPSTTTSTTLATTTTSSTPPTTVAPVSAGTTTTTIMSVTTTTTVTPMAFTGAAHTSLWILAGSLLILAGLFLILMVRRPAR